jgi:hypothetical protein
LKRHDPYGFLKRHDPYGFLKRHDPYGFLKRHDPYGFLKRHDPTLGPLAQSAVATENLSRDGYFSFPLDKSLTGF